MSNRVKHRAAATERRLARIDAGEPLDPSRRERTPRRRYRCPSCAGEFRQPWQWRIHAVLRACQVSS